MIPSLRPGKTDEPRHDVQSSLLPEDGDTSCGNAAAWQPQAAAIVRGGAE